ncbi:spermidine synthase [Flavobacterium celericrescens]|uniref:Methyltransferase domain-containing protein n=1 Tax=Flavobacterium celericrescens TaxID=2709780 RepID=A0ABX0IDA2_9FLAO|nr:fused MFS/spermidine synthase [Flavobacterium celericrescens]NHM05163.1 methyltransferase domain-containing protein [Flavobacterium celericrescens]
MIKQLLSYFLPIKIYETQSTVSSNLEVTWNNGKLVLDSKHTNYSYGSLEKVLRKGFQQIGYKTILEMKSVLLLGVAGGSAIKTLIEDIGYKGSITGVEIDAEVIKIANTYFGLNQYKNVTIIIDDAQKHIEEHDVKYNLIIIDIFEDSNMPDFLFEEKFINNIKKSLELNGYILFNFMILNDYEKKFTAFKSKFNSSEFKVINLVNVEEFNQLLIIQKII